MSVDVHVSFVLDRSGSMGHLTDSTVQGFNQFLKEQRAEQGNAWLSLTLFDDKIEVPFPAWNVKDIPDMTVGHSGDNPYYVRGMTALLDAVGVSIKGAEKWQKNNEWFTGKMLVVIQTDGCENHSMEWNRQQIKDLMESKKNAGWEFIFLGTGEGSWLEGSDFSQVVGVANTINYAGNDAAHSQAYSSVSSSTSMLRSAGKMNVDQSWNKDRDANLGQHEVNAK